MWCRVIVRLIRVLCRLVIVFIGVDCVVDCSSVDGLVGNIDCVRWVVGFISGMVLVSGVVMVFIGSWVIGVLLVCSGVVNMVMVSVISVVNDFSGMWDEFFL